MLYNRTYILLYRRQEMESIDNEFYSLMCGKLLGKGQVFYQKNSELCFRFRHRHADYDWAAHCHQKLKSHIPSLSYSQRKDKDFGNNIDFTDYFTVEGQTNNHLTAILQQWFSVDKKVLPLAYLEKNLDALALAWWYQDSGHLKQKENGTLEKIILSTEQWSDEELEILKYLLTLKHSLLFSVDGQRRLILYDQFQINYFLHLVRPYMHSSQTPKMKTCSVLKPIAKRTTICLDNSISISKPTLEINDKISQFACSFQLTEESFRRLNFKRREQNETSYYQIQLGEKNRCLLEAIQASTGLTISEIVQECYHQSNCKNPKPLHSLVDLTTTQQNIILGSIIGDGMLTHYPTKHMGVRSSYSEHFSIDQSNYRAWKLMKLSPYLTFTTGGTVLASKVDDLWSELQSLFYVRTSQSKIRVKRLPNNLFNDMNDLHSLATIYMDDGSLMISYRINHRTKCIYLIPHIALYLQNFTEKELTMLREHINKLTSVFFSLSKRPDGHGLSLRTYQTGETLRFLNAISGVTETCPSMSYKVNWDYRFYVEKQKWKEKYPDYKILTSSRERMRPYTSEEIAILVAMKRSNRTDREIAEKLKRSYWAIVYKAADLRKRGQL